MADHFTLDVDPGELRKVAGNLETLRTNVMAKGTTVTGTPDEIGEGWKGDAASKVKSEMTTLGSRMTGLGGKLFPITEALRELAGKYDVALEKLPDLNRRWNAAQTTYDNAVAASEQQMDRDEDALRDDQGRPNQFLQHEIENGHTNRVSAASTARQNTQDAIQAEYDEIVDQLELDTAALGTTLNDQTPVTVTEEQIEAWQSGSWPEPDMTTLLTGLDLTASRQEQEERERLTPQVEEDVQALQDALEDGDQEAINEALEALGEHADDDVYTDILVDQLGVDGVQDLYLQIDESLTSSETDMETLWPALEGFNDAIANGISQRSDEEMAPFVEAWMDADYGAKMWALVTASENADGRVNAVAMAYQSEIYNAALSNAGSMPGLFPQVFNYAYEEGEDMLDRWDDRSSGEDLARILQHASEEHVDDLLFRLTNVQTDGGTMREEDFQHLADLWGETVMALRDDWAEGHANGDAGSLQLLMRVLEERNRNVGYPYGDMMTPYVTDLVNDPNLMDQILKDALDGRLDASDVSSLINDSGVKVEDLIAAVTQHQLESGETAEAAAENIGALLRAGDVIDAGEMDWSELTQSMATEALGMAADAGKFTPGGPLITLFEGLYEEIQRQQEAGENWDEATGNSAAQQIIAFSLYTQHHGVPDGFEDYAEQQEGNVPPSEIVTRYLDEMRARGGEDWEQMRLLLDTINDTRDDT